LAMLALGLTQLEAKIPIAVRRGFSKQRRNFCLHLFFSENGKRVFGTCHRKRGDILLLAVPIQPHSDIGQRLRTLGANETTQSSSEIISNKLFSITAFPAIRF